MFRVYDEFAINNFRNYLNTVNWNYVINVECDDSNIIYRSFIDKFSEGFSACFRLKLQKTKIGGR